MIWMLVLVNISSPPEYLATMRGGDTEEAKRRCLIVAEAVNEAAGRDPKRMLACWRVDPATLAQ